MSASPFGTPVAKKDGHLRLVAMLGVIFWCRHCGVLWKAGRYRAPGKGHWRKTKPPCGRRTA